jgi:hypothetical protein
VGFRRNITHDVRKRVHNALMEALRAISQPATAAARPALINALVISADARFHQRAEAVIGEVGEVSSAPMAPADGADVAWLVEESCADVVVLDASGCEAAVASAIAALAATAPRLGVVVVCEHLTSAARGLGALPKWGWMRDLRVAVQHAYIDGSPLTPPRERLHAARRDLRGVAPSSAARR